MESIYVLSLVLGGIAFAFAARVSSRRLVLVLGVVASVALGCDAPPTMTVATPTVATGKDILVTFDKPIAGRATDQYWITILPPSAPESDTTGRIILDRGITSFRLRAPAPGDYEVRLHTQYPKREFHLVARTPIKVMAWSVTAHRDLSSEVGSQP